jgi:uncharacterized YccA/Bax inhibitor family protein
MARQMLNDSTFTRADARPAERAAAARTMSIGGTVAKALFFLVVTAGFAGLGWKLAAHVLVQSSLWVFLGYLLLVALTIAAAANPRLALGAGLLYAVLTGLWIGAISRVYEQYYEGIVAQALIASLTTVLACLVLYLSRAFRLTRNAVRVIIAATIGVGLMYFVGWIFSLFGLDLLFWTDPGNPAGIAISVAICIVAALNLMLDFGFIEQGVKLGAPKDYEWYSAFGLLATIVWLYLELLRLIARTRS